MFNKNDAYEFQKYAKKKAVEIYNENYNQNLQWDDIYLVWYAKTLQNHKCLLSTPISGDGCYIEVTFNGDKNEIYIDMYKKVSNTCIDCLNSKVKNQIIKEKNI